MSYCTYCGSARHNVEMCPKTHGGQINRNNLRCTYCGSTQHNVNACPKTWAGNANHSGWNRHTIENDYLRD